MTTTDAPARSTASLDILGFRTEFYLHDLTVLTQANRIGFELAGFNEHGQLVLQGVDIGEDGVGSEPIDLRRYAGAARIENDHEYGGIYRGKAIGATYLQVREADGRTSDPEDPGFDLHRAAKLRGRHPVPKTPGKTTPGKTTPGKTTPGKTTPGKTTPGKTTPGKVS